MIFAREVSGPLTSLVKKLDEATAKHRKAQLGSFVVFCSDDQKLEKQLKELAEKEKLMETILTIDAPAGPEGYQLAKDAAVTIVFYVGYDVKVNYSFKKGALKDQDVDKIAADLAKVLPK